MNQQRSQPPYQSRDSSSGSDIANTLKASRGSNYNFVANTTANASQYPSNSSRAGDFVANTTANASRYPSRGNDFVATTATTGLYPSSTISSLGRLSEDTFGSSDNIYRVNFRPPEPSPDSENPRQLYTPPQPIPNSRRNDGGNFHRFPPGVSSRVSTNDYRDSASDVTRDRLYQAQPAASSEGQRYPMGFDLPPLSNHRGSSIAQASSYDSINYHQDVVYPEQQRQPTRALIYPERAHGHPPEALVNPGRAHGKPTEALVNPGRAHGKPTEALVNPERVCGPRSLGQHVDYHYPPESIKPKKFHTMNLQKDNLLGVGSYGSVYKARCDDVQICAAKVIHTVFQERGEGSPHGRFVYECECLSCLRHPNIVQYLGTHLNEEGKVILLIELMDKSLTSFLESPPAIPPFHTQVNICHDIAMALSFLHSHGIIHRDLSSNNILMIGDRRLEVTDFGMAKLIPTNGKYTTFPGTRHYMPPEALLHDSVYDAAINCFSLGVLSLQVLTGKFPHPTKSLEAVDGNLRPVPEVQRRQDHIMIVNQSHPVLAIALTALKDQSTERPPAKHPV